MSDIAPYLIDTGYVELPEEFLLPIFTTRDRFDMIISALLVGGEVLYGEDEILHFVDFLDALPDVREYDLMTYDDLVAQIGAAQADATQALKALTARRATLWMDEAHYIVGIPTVLVGDAYMANFVRYTTTNLAEFTFSFVSGALIDGGVYMVGSKGNTSGIVEVRIDGLLIGSVNLYNATTLNNELLVVGGFGFGNPTFAAGYHKMNVKVNGKHASSAGFAAAFTKVYIRTNAD